MTTRREFLGTAATVGVGAVLPLRQVEAATAAAPAAPAAAPSATSPKLPMFVNQLPVPMPPLASTTTVPAPVDGSIVNVPAYEVSIGQLTQQLGFVNSKGIPLATPVYGYGGSYPGPTIESVAGQPLQVRWINNLPANVGLAGPHLLAPAIDPMMLAPTYFPAGLPQLRVVTHVHGGHQAVAVDGTPFEWYTSPNDPFAANRNGPHNTAGNDTFVYSNKQRAATLWYHDHAFGITRINVWAGLAGFFLVRDPNEAALGLPRNTYPVANPWDYREVPVALQDRTFNADGTLFYPVPPAPPEVFGDTIVVNGKVWPKFTVRAQRYRFRFLNGANSRFFRLTIVEADALGNPIKNNKKLVPGPAMYQIGTDGGFLAAPVQLNTLNPATGLLDPLVLGNGERADVIIDFAGFADPAGLVNRYFLVYNDASTPFANTPSTKGAIPEIMLFEVLPGAVADTTTPVAQLQLPAPERLNPATATRTRNMVLQELMVGKGLVVTLNSMGYVTDPLTGLPYPGATTDPALAATEAPVIGTTEIWNIINLTPDTHPIHLHHSMFQLQKRQAFNVLGYTAVYVPGQPNTNPDPTPFLLGAPTPAAQFYPNEYGWKDTIRANPGEVTTILVRFDGANSNGTPDPLLDGYYTGNYVWHCHILEHEENDMMRPLQVNPAVALAAEADG